MFAAARAGRLHREFRQLTEKKKKSERSKSASKRDGSSTPSSSRRSSSAFANGQSGRRRGDAVTSIEWPLSTTLGLKSLHVKGLKVTWNKLYEPVRPGFLVGLLERAFEKLKVKDPAVKSMFVSAAFMDWRNRRTSGTGTTVRDHAKLIIEFMNTVINGLESPPQETLNYIDDVGRKHNRLRSIGFKSKMWEHIGEALIDVIIVQETVRAFPEATKAWTILLAAATDRLNASFNQRMKTQRSVVIEDPDWEKE